MKHVSKLFKTLQRLLEFVQSMFQRVDKKKI